MLHVFLLLLHFSSHIKNIISTIECSDSNTLVIMDELGAGTDPGEGVGIAVAVLEEVYRKGATILATAHCLYQPRTNIILRIAESIY